MPAAALAANAVDVIVAPLIALIRMSWLAVTP